jgi:hypothetical protein
LITLVVVRRHLYWLRLEAVLAVVSLGTAMVVTQLRGPSEGDLLDALSFDVVQLLETASLSEHHDHGHIEVTEDDRVVCAAEAFGHDPVSVRSVSEVRWAYAYYMCATAPPGTPWSQAARISGPVAVSITDGEVRIAQAGLGYQDRVKALIPARYADRTDGFRDPAIPTRLLDRYQVEIAQV